MRFPRMIVLHNFSASKMSSRVYTQDSFLRRSENARGGVLLSLIKVHPIMHLGRILSEVYSAVA